MFDPVLAAYWGASEFPSALDTGPATIHANPARIDRIKLSLLDEGKDLELRGHGVAGGSVTRRLRNALRCLPVTRQTTTQHPS